MITDIELSWYLATKFHAGQTYGDGKPYTTHLDSVRNIVSQMNKEDERLAIIANLHDILEDTSMTEEALRVLFDKDVIDAVVAMTKVEGVAEEDYLVQVRQNALARQVKMADSMSNLSASVKRMDIKRIKKYTRYLSALA